MICDVCKRCLEGIHDPTVTPRLRVLPVEDDSSRGTQFRERCTLFDIENYEFGHHRTQDSLIQSMEQQCLVCAYFRFSAVFRYDGHKVTSADDGYFTTFKVSVDKKVLEMDLISSEGYSRMSACLKPLEVVQKRNKLALELDNNTGGQCTRKLINEWDKNCLANHIYCGQASDSAFLPTRLLEINDVGNPTTCRLVLREEVPCASRYTALSYRWGAMKTKGETRLLESTFDTMRTGLPLSSLPKTYVDAIDVTSWLGIRYIWIDAICIIQDLLHDWRAEASTMQAIYRNSYLTISAIAGTHDNPGLFYARDPVRVQPTIVNIAYTSCDNPVPFVHRDEKRKEAESFQMGNVTMERGWCLQERLLSPRVLHFGSHQVFWECREQRASDRTPESLDVGKQSHVLEGGRTRLWKLFIGDIQFRHGRDPYEDLLREWYDTLRIYSTCQLTYASDKLVAISGLANDMRSALNTRRPDKYHTYLAGLWYEDVRFGLCWRMKGFGRRPAVYRAPSWSPMSVDGAIIYIDLRKRGGLTYYISDADCTAITHCLNDLDTGEVTGGQLELRGPWVTIMTTGRKVDFYNNCFHAHFQYLEPSSALETPLVVEADDSVCHDTEIIYDTQDDMAKQAFCMPICTWRRERPTWFFRGIVLVPVEDGGPNYRRIGLVDGFFKTEEVAHTFFSQFPRRSVTVT